MGVMIRICAWCGMVLGKKDDEGSGCEETGGCCEPCLRQFFPNEAEEVLRLAALEGQ